MSAGNGSVGGADERFVTPARTITEADLVAFSTLTGDFHPQHTDAEWAGASEFGGRIAQGMLVLSYAVGLAPIDPERVLALRGLDSVSFKRPVRIGDTIRLEGRLNSRRPVGSGASLAGYRWRVLNQRDETVATALVTVVIRGEGAAPSEPAARAGEERIFDEVFL